MCGTENQGVGLMCVPGSNQLSPHICANQSSLLDQEHGHCFQDRQEESRAPSGDQLVSCISESLSMLCTWFLSFCSILLTRNRVLSFPYVWRRQWCYKTSFPSLRWTLTKVNPAFDPCLKISCYCALAWGTSYLIASTILTPKLCAYIFPFLEAERNILKDKYGVSLGQLHICKVFSGHGCWFIIWEMEQWDGLLQILLSLPSILGYIWNYNERGLPVSIFLLKALKFTLDLD